MKKILLSLLLFSAPFILAANGNNDAQLLEGKWKPHDISITMDGVPSVILSAMATQIKNDPSSECVKNSVIEVLKTNTYKVTNACEEDGDMDGTWKLEGNKLRITLSKYPELNETVTIKSINADLITVDVTDKIPDGFELNGSKPTLLLILKRM